MYKVKALFYFNFMPLPKLVMLKYKYNQLDTKFKDLKDSKIAKLNIIN